MAIYAMQQIPQPPDSRTYSAEVTSFLSNLPHHRRLRPKQALDYDITTRPQSQAQIEQNSLVFSVFRPALRIQPPRRHRFPVAGAVRWLILTFLTIGGASQESFALLRSFGGLFEKVPLCPVRRDRLPWRQSGLPPQRSPPRCSAPPRRRPHRPRSPRCPEPLPPRESQYPALPSLRS